VIHFVEKLVSSKSLVQVARAATAIGVTIVLCGAAPWPEAVANHVREMDASCKQVHGQPVTGPRIEYGRLDEGPEYWAVDEAGYQCSGAESLFSGTGGSQVTVYLAQTDRPPRKAFEHGAYGTVIEPDGDRSKIWITVGGPMCGQTGEIIHATMMVCDRQLRWDETSEKLDFAPVSEARIKETTNSPAADAQSEKVSYDSGSDIDSPKAYVFRAYWSDQSKRIDWSAPVQSRGSVYNTPFVSADGRNLMISTLQSAACDPLCPVRVFTASHRKIMDFEACKDRDQYRISSDHRILFACTQSFAIPQVTSHDALMENAPPGSNREAYVRVALNERSRGTNAPQPIHVIPADHNNSQMLVSEWKDGTIEITYDTPRSGLPVARGTLLFRGRRDGDRYSGTAYMFTSGCAPAPFAVAGMENHRKEAIVLAGATPHRIPGSCDVVAGVSSDRLSTLVFDTRFYGDQ
jgi:hypothetical protein